MKYKIMHGYMHRFLNITHNMPCLILQQACKPPFELLSFDKLYFTWWINSTSELNPAAKTI